MFVSSPLLQLNIRANIFFFINVIMFIILDNFYSQNSWISSYSSAIIVYLYNCYLSVE